MPVFNKMVYNGTEYILGGGGNIGEPLNLTVIPVGLDAIITWEDNEIGTIPPTTFQKSELVRKIGSAPTSPSDGDLVVTETVKDTYKVSGYVDQGLTDGETYYYRVFSYSDLGGISYCDAVSVTISNSWQPGVDTVLYYDFEHTTGTAEENLAVSGSTYDGVYTATPTISTLASGKKYFDGSDKTCLYTSNRVTTIDYANATVNLWIKIEGQNGNLFGQAWWNMGNNPTIKSEIYNGAMTSCLGHSNNELSSNVPSGWSNIVLVNDGTTAKIYINGALADSKSFTAATKTKDYYFYINAFETADQTPPPRSNLLGTYSFGSVIIENKTWSAQDISDYFDQTKGDYGIS